MTRPEQTLARLIADAATDRARGRTPRLPSESIARLVVEISAGGEESFGRFFGELGRMLRDGGVQLPPLDELPESVAPLLAVMDAFVYDEAGEIDVVQTADQMDARLHAVLGTSPRAMREAELRAEIREEISSSVAETMRKHGLVPLRDTPSFVPELDEIHQRFLDALSSDQDPPSTVALFWHEAISVKRAPDAPDAITRGTTRLKYFDGPSMVRDVPSLNFPEDKRPFAVCERLIKQGAATYEGPRMISFRYDRESTGWVGGYSVETSAQYRDLVVGRAEIDARLVDALRSKWKKGLTNLALVYGVHGWKEWGPKLKLSKGFAAELLDPSPEILEPWNELVAYMTSHGVKHIYYASIAIDKPTAKPREGEGIQFQYDR